MSRALGLILVLATAGSARAEELALEGAYLPGMLHAHLDATGVASAATTWNGATRQLAAEAAGEVRLFERVRLVLRVADAIGTPRPGAGLGMQWLDEQRHGVAATAYLLYKAEGFTEPEGEIEGSLSFGRFLGRLHVGLDVTYGQDVDAHERDGEVAFAVQAAPVAGVAVGALGHYRDALGSPGENGVIRDLSGGASATVAVHHVGVTAIAGIAGVGSRTSPFAIGPAATLAIGAAF